MRIGELAKLAGTSARSLRYYETQGLLSARRAANGHREYDETDLRLVREIRALLDIGFALEDTRPFVECLRAGHATGGVCPDSIATYRRKLGELDEYLQRLHVIRDQLRDQLDAAITHRERTCPHRNANTP